MTRFFLFLLLAGSWVLPAGLLRAQSDADSSHASTRHSQYKTSLLSSDSATEKTSQQAEESGDKFEFDILGGPALFFSRGDQALWPLGFTSGVWVGYFLDPRALIGVRATFSDWAGDTGAFNQKYLPTPVTYWTYLGSAYPAMNVFTFAPNLKLNLSSSKNAPLQPYIMVGAGILNKSMQDGTVAATDAGNNSAAIVNVAGYSTTAPMVSVAFGIPILLGDGFKIPIEAETMTAFTSPQNTSLGSLKAGLSRDW